MRNPFPAAPRQTPVTPSCWSNSRWSVGQPSGRPPPQIYHELRQRLVARDGLLEMRQQARNQRHALLQWPVVVAGVRAQLDELISSLSTRIQVLEAEIAAIVQAGEWATSASYL